MKEETNEDKLEVYGVEGKHKSKSPLSSVLYLKVTLYRRRASLNPRSIGNTIYKGIYTIRSPKRVLANRICSNRILVI